MNKTIFSVFALVGLVSTGCVKREILGFQDHPTSNVTSLEVMKRTTFPIVKAEHIFYTCTDNGNQLVCKRLCGGNTDLDCPTGYSNGNGTVSTNVR